MKQLSTLDAAFLYLETPETPMHVGALHLLRLPANYRGDFAAAVRTHLAGRLHLAPALARTLVVLPLNFANPVWRDAASVDINRHVLSLALARPGDMKALHSLVAARHAEVMDRTRPLWQFFVITGLNESFGQGTVALYTKLHHAAVDGKAAVALASAILDLAPRPRVVAHPSPWVAPVGIGMAEMIGGVFSNQLSQIGKVVKMLPAAAVPVRNLLTRSARSMLASRSSQRDALPRLSLAPRTRFNNNVSRTRAFAAATVPLSQLKAIGKSFGASVNDMVLLLVSEALRGYLQQHRALPRRPLQAAVPVSLRAEGDASSNTQASMTVVSLATHIADPLQRLAAIVKETVSMRDTFGQLKSVLPTDWPSLGLPWLVRGANALYGRARLAERLPNFANLAISNVPGPGVPLYLAGAELLAHYPTSIIVHGVALNVTVQSYNGQLCFGCIACGQAAPD